MARGEESVTSLKVHSEAACEEKRKGVSRRRRSYDLSAMGTLMVRSKLA
jgi:hypothetical protein